VQVSRPLHNSRKLFSAQVEEFTDHWPVSSGSRTTTRPPSSMRTVVPSSAMVRSTAAGAGAVSGSTASRTDTVPMPELEMLETNALPVVGSTATPNACASTRIVPMTSRVDRSMTDTTRPLFVT